MDMKTAERAKEILAKIDQCNYIIDKLSEADRPICFAEYDESVIRNRMCEIDAESLMMIIGCYAMRMAALDEELKNL